jgi:hypothetical protein
MALSFGRWRPKHLVGAWAAYWLALALVTLGPAMLAIRDAVRAGAGKGNVSLGFDNSILHLTVVREGITTWSGTASLAYVMALVVGPPLALWLLWIARRSRATDPARERVNVGS